MQPAMEDFDDDMTVIDLRGAALDDLVEPPALPFLLTRRKDDPDRNVILRLLLRRLAS
ncbi:MAG: hypothetical protein H6719_28880 [Sandaracinaceae bacterium]|nr:hypothetical protein [Sandaracinaceae bacterium]